MKSNMPAQSHFSNTPKIQGIQRSVFNRSHTHKSTFYAGNLVPFYIDEILPGDSQDVKANIFARLASPLEFPIMDNIFLDTFYFFVPNRILWDNWVKFMGERTNPDDSIDFLTPQVTYTSPPAIDTLGDFFGLPTENTPSSVNSFHHRAYVKIWNEWFRDQNLQDSLQEYSNDGPQSDDKFPIQKRGKRHDYFTSCIPFPQKGDAVGIPLIGGLYPVQGTNQSLGLTTDNATPLNYGMYNQGTYMKASDEMYDQTLPWYDASPGVPASDFRALGITTDPTKSGMEVDVSGGTAVLINDLRLSIATQQLLETDARGGTRYIELLKAHFGVTSPDYRLQRPEYLGGSTQMMNVNPVTQTSATATETPLGELSAFGTVSSRSGYSKSFTEHGVIIGLVNIRADLTYQSGLNKMFTRRERLDYYWPTFANLGEQAVLNKEIFFSNVPAEDDAVFGYQERWAEYRYYPSKITGSFRSTATLSLDAWHLSQEFDGIPVLGPDFIEESVPLDRVLAVTGDDIPQIIFDSYIEIRHARPMPVYSVPGLGRL